MTIEDKEKQESNPATAQEIGAWLLQRIEQAAPGHCDQGRTVRAIMSTYGAEWAYKNDNGNWAISREVLKEFNKLKYPNIQWESGIQAWQLVSDEKLGHILERKARMKRRKEEIAQAKAEQVKAP